MNEKLKPCPFCGGEAEITKTYAFDYYFYVGCQRCRVETGYYDTEEEAINAWNTRVEENLIDECTSNSDSRI